MSAAVLSSLTGSADDRLADLVELAKYAVAGRQSTRARPPSTGADAPGSTAESLNAASHTERPATSIAENDDVQLSLFLLYASVYGAFDELRADLEWHPRLIEVRQVLEQAFERELRERIEVPEFDDRAVSSQPAHSVTPAEPVQAAEIARTLFALTEADTGPSLSRFIAREASLEQLQEFLMLRSIYTLREADPHSWAIPRLTGAPKAALVEIQSDEYGGGRPDRVHSVIFARTMRGVGLDDSYGAYLDRVPALTLASQNMMSMFGLNRRLLGAIVGHLAAFEMTSSVPNRFYGDGFRRHGFDESVTDYFDEHVEADAVHEQIAAHDLAGGLAVQRPALLPDILFGAAACLAVDGWAAAHTLDCWQRGESALVRPNTDHDFAE